MRAKQIAARRQRNQQIAETDALHRCALCKIDLAQAAEIWEGFLTPGKFCSEACLEEYGKRVDR